MLSLTTAGTPLAADKVTYMVWGHTQLTSSTFNAPDVWTLGAERRNGYGCKLIGSKLYLTMATNVARFESTSYIELSGLEVPWSGIASLIIFNVLLDYDVDTEVLSCEVFDVSGVSQGTLSLNFVKPWAQKTHQVGCVFNLYLFQAATGDAGRFGLSVRGLMFDQDP